jgi:hypothetical protein
MRTASERTRPTARIAALAVIAFAIGGGACHSGSKPKPPTATTPVADGESIGKIERSAGGTAVVTDIRTLLTLSCGDGQLTLKTNLETLTGGMDCSRMVGQSIADRFLGQPVAVTYTGGAVQIENPAAGTIILPNIKDLTRTNSDATP